jgi:hypothetical protein
MNAVSDHLTNLSGCRHHRIIVQSSGYGKTKLCLELLKKHRGVYFLCSEIRGSGGQPIWSPCQFIKDFLAEMDKSDDVDKIHRFVHKIYETLKAFDGAGPLFGEQFDIRNGVMKSDFYQKFLPQLSSPSRENYFHMQSPTTPVRYPLDSPNSLLPVPLNLLESSSDATMPSVQRHHDPFLIVFDESHAFKPETFSLLKYYLDKHHVLGLFLSTSSHLNQMLPPNHSNRGGALEELLPLFYLPTTDMYAHHPFHFGRPLWFHHFHQRCDGEFRNLIRYCVNRLTDFSVNEELTRKSHLALFMCRFGGMSPSCLKVAGDFVTQHLATISSLNLEFKTNNRGLPMRETTYEILYPSEPVLAEASCYRTSSLCSTASASASSSHADVLRTILLQVQSPSIVSVNRGDLGEIIGATLFGYSMDFIRSARLHRHNYCQGASETLDNTFSCHVSLTDFLKFLYPQLYDFTDKETVTFLKDIEGFYLNFTHFIKLPVPGNETVCLEAITRHAGILTKDYCKAIDLFFTAFKVSSQHPVKKEQEQQEEEEEEQQEEEEQEEEEKKEEGPPTMSPVSEMLHVRVSMKNYLSDALTQVKVTKFLNDIHPTKTEPVDHRSSVPLAISLLINVGRGKMEPLVRLNKKVKAAPNKAAPETKEKAAPATNEQAAKAITVSASQAAAAGAVQTRSVTASQAAAAAGTGRGARKMKVKHLQLALPLNDKACFVGLPDNVRDLLLQIADCRPKVRSQPAQNFGYRIATAINQAAEVLPTQI